LGDECGWVNERGGGLVGESELGGGGLVGESELGE